MDNFIEEILNGLKLLKIIHEFEYDIKTQREDYLLLRVYYDNKKYLVEVQKI